MRRRNLYITATLVFAMGVLSFAGSGWAQDVKAMAKSLANLQVAADTVWVMVAGFLVFLCTRVSRCSNRGFVARRTPSPFSIRISVS